MTLFCFVFLLKTKGSPANTIRDLMLVFCFLLSIDCDLMIEAETPDPFGVFSFLEFGKTLSITSPSISEKTFLWERGAATEVPPSEASNSVPPGETIFLLSLLCVLNPAKRFPPPGLFICELSGLVLW